MRFASDIDGVEAVFVQSFDDHAVENFGAPSLLPVSSWHWYRGYGVPTEGLWASYWSDADRIRSCPVEPGAVDAMRAIKAEGHDVLIVTYRPEISMEATVDWLDLNGFPYDEVHSVADKGTVDWDVLVDDHGPTVSDLVAAGRDVILFDQPWNEEYEHLRRARGWGEVLMLLSVRTEPSVQR